MAVVKKDTLSVVPASSVTVVFKKKPQKILDEDTYTKVNLVQRNSVYVCTVNCTYVCLLS